MISCGAGACKWEDKRLKYCTHCGAAMYDEAVVCVQCGCQTEQYRPVPQAAPDDSMSTLIKVFLIIGCVVEGWLIIPLAWCIPITVAVFHRLRDRQPISTGLKVCTLLFVSMVSGICLLCMNEDI